MAKARPSHLCPLMFRFLDAPVHALFQTRSLTQKPLCKDLKRNGQSPAITLEATYTPVSNRVSSRSLLRLFPPLVVPLANRAAVIGHRPWRRRRKPDRHVVARQGLCEKLDTVPHRVT